MARRLHTLRARHLLITGYVILVLVVSLGFVRMEALANRIEYESQLQAKANCESANSSKQAVLFLTTALREFARDPADPVSEEKAKDDFVDRIREGVTLDECPPDPLP